MLSVTFLFRMVERVIASDSLSKHNAIGYEVVKDKELEDDYEVDPEVNNQVNNSLEPHSRAVPETRPEQPCQDLCACVTIFLYFDQTRLLELHGSSDWFGG